MTAKLTYLFDPLCGWCYGAAPALARLRDAGVAVKLLPTGLFTGAGARTMDAGFAAFAWSNDQRIATLTGQVFSEAYRSKVLGAPGSLFDSGPATLALTAVARHAPEREFEALGLIQQARYVEGRDVSALPALTGILSSAGFAQSAADLKAPDAGLLVANRDRVERGLHMMQTLGARGVPALVLEDESGLRLIPSDALFGDLAPLIAVLKAA